MNWGMEGERKKVKLRVWNGQEGRPTIVWYGGSGNGLDGSSNYNFMKELLHRYAGGEPNDVYHKPELKPETAEKVDKGGSFCMFLLEMPFQIARTLFMTLWNVIRAAKWAGGNGFGPTPIAMNFTKEDSNRLYGGCKAQGVKPFAAFTYAAVKASNEVLRQKPLRIVQQASLQTSHYPVPGATTRDLVGDWLFGPLQVLHNRTGNLTVTILLCSLMAYSLSKLQPDELSSPAPD